MINKKLTDDLNRLKANAGYNTTFHVITIKDYENETFEDAIKRYEKENNCKVLPEQPMYKIHVRNKEQIRADMEKK